MNMIKKSKNCEPCGGDTTYFHENKCIADCIEVGMKNFEN